MKRKFTCHKTSVFLRQMNGSHQSPILPMFGMEMADGMASLGRLRRGISFRCQYSLPYRSARHVLLLFRTVAVDVV